MGLLIGTIIIYYLVWFILYFLITWLYMYILSKFNRWYIEKNALLFSSFLLVLSIFILIFIGGNIFPNIKGIMIICVWFISMFIFMKFYWYWFFWWFLVTVLYLIFFAILYWLLWILIITMALNLKPWWPIDNFLTTFSKKFYTEIGVVQNNGDKVNDNKSKYGSHSIRSYNSKIQSNLWNIQSAIALKEFEWVSLESIFLISEDNIINWKKIIINDDSYLWILNYEVLNIVKEDFLHPSWLQYIVLLNSEKTKYQILTHTIINKKDRYDIDKEIVSIWEIWNEIYKVWVLTWKLINEEQYLKNLKN